jgi:hypothetical protein
MGIPIRLEVTSAIPIQLVSACSDVTSLWVASYPTYGVSRKN